MREVQEPSSKMLESSMFHLMLHVRNSKERYAIVADKGFLLGTGTETKWFTAYFQQDILHVC